MKTLLVGNHSCSNRGDAAITRGLLQFLNNNEELVVYSRFPKGASEILGVKVLDDHTKITIKNNNFFSKAVNKICWLINADPTVLFMIIVYYIPSLKRYLPENILLMISQMKEADRIIQVGGSFFVDLYGLGQFRLIMCSLLAGKPIYLIGHSLGPFNGYLYKKVAGWCFNRCKSIVIRDEVSSSQVSKIYPSLDFIFGADTAWLVPPKVTNETVKDNAVALTARNLAPFDRRLGISQDEYEIKMALLCENLIDNGLEVRFFSTCTDFDGYHNDDRVVAISIRSKVKESKREHVKVYMTEFDDVELGFEFSKCKFTIGTRLHSCIISMNFGTPAIAIGYEHKSKGLYSSMGLNDFIIDLKEFNEFKLISKADEMRKNIEKYNELYSSAVNKQRTLAADAAELSLNN